MTLQRGFPAVMIWPVDSNTNAAASKRSIRLTIPNLIRRVSFACSTLFLVFMGLFAHGQTYSDASVSWIGGALCNHGGQKNGPTAASCSGVIPPNDGGYAGTGVSTAGANYSVLGIGGGVTVSTEGGGPISMQSTATAQVYDGFTIGNVPANSFFLLVTSLAASQGGSGQATVIEQVDINSNAMRNECVTEVFGSSSCSVQLPVSEGTVVGLSIFLAGSASWSCEPTCTGGASSFTAGRTVPASLAPGKNAAPGGGKVIAVKVVDSNGNPVSGATITSTSGHKYPTRFASTTVLVASPNPSTQGQSVTFTATIASFGRSSTPTGKVTFKDSSDGTILGRSSLAAGVATFATFALSSGSHTITATYGGDVWSTGSHATVDQAVN